ncbi:SDR family NAD(P)-dependent oxidoreductase [Aidingimonas halophila]|uniref:NAD(P)-dependent dehydrogenase, short-chain alcohol dehydrogenase family n=1 Tax=Aidingimonas halophila TaxID=574349 RepID=A0A1H3EV50_9GAMM|nr:SDR family NAD(P)-dependent oxidoreductase [Aidingimonas halophila]GHC31807.1 short-chain dehydrogenase [Aidingimonas halophila]SDX82641.1 NAD(P)-dependent dehydrogenase, short-chain alcohol dehydrogenase family [Aidingimonas halophila]
MLIQDRTFLITGAASGLGAATAERLIGGGAQVVLCDLNGTVEEQARRLGDAALAVQGDVTSESDLQAGIDKAVRSSGELHGVIHCAGVVNVAKLVDREGQPADLDAYVRTIHINLVGTFNVLRLAAAVMTGNTPNHEGERGVMVTTASIAAFDGQVGQAAYSASKAGVAGMTLPLARELSRHGIRVMSIAPGVFETPMMGDLPDDAVAALTEAVPFPKRLGKPAEYAQLVEQIITNPMLNGEVIRLDGGIRMQ